MSVNKQRLVKYRWRLLCIVLSLMLCSSMAHANHREPPQIGANDSGKLLLQATDLDYRDSYHVGIPPIMSPLQLEQAYGASVLSLHEALDRPVVFRTKLSLVEFGQAVRAEEYDILFVHPVVFLEMALSAHYLPVARRSDELSVLLVSGKESQLESMNDLLSVSIGWLPEITITTRMTKHHLNNFGILPNELDSQVFRNYYDCMLALIQGKIDVCVTTPKMLESFSEQLNVEFKVISETSAVPQKMVAVHQRVSAEHRQMIAETVLGWGRNQESRELLGSMGANYHGAQAAFIQVTPEFLDNAQVLKLELNK